jgi:hypothetical protein
MAKITTTLPQAEIAIPSVTISELVSVLPDELPWDLNVWIGGNLARYGKDYGNQIFLVELDEEPSDGMVSFFDGLVAPLGIHAAASNTWRNNQISAVRLYNSGKLIVDRETLAYKELPSTVESAPELTADYFLSKLPEKIPYVETIWLTGGLVRSGASFKDADIFVGRGKISENGEITFGPTGVDPRRLGDIVRYFSNLVGWRVDAGRHVMPDKEPIWAYKLYENGKRVGGE